MEVGVLMGSLWAWGKRQRGDTAAGNRSAPRGTWPPEGCFSGPSWLSQAPQVPEAGSPGSPDTWVLQWGSLEAETRPRVTCQPREQSLAARRWALCFFSITRCEI